MVCTDRGSNEVNGRRLVSAEISQFPNIYFFEQDCLEHAPHLVVMSSLLLMDHLLDGKVQWRYWSSLAMLSHTCRSQAKELYECYCKRFGAKRGKDTVQTLLPRPVSQRWGRIHELERRIIMAGLSELAICLADILTSKWIDVGELRNFSDQSLDNGNWEAVRCIREALQRTQKSNSQELKKIDDHSKLNTPNELSVEQTKAYSLKMGKWRAQTLNAVSDESWGHIVRVMRECRAPLIHISHFLKKKYTQKDIIEHGGPLAMLVYGRAESFQDEFDAILKSICSFGFAH